MPILLLLVIATCSVAAQPHLDHAAWNGLLQRYVNAANRVDYAAWQKNDLPALDSYLAQLAQPWPSALPPAETKAASINAYNALTVRWMLRHYPAKSIWQTKKPFSAARHSVNGKLVSLDDIEKGLRALGDPRVHAVLVCAARSCPPLRREAYDPAQLDAQLDDNSRAWLANSQLNTFDSAKRQADISSIFTWYRSDFDGNGQTLQQFLTRLGPPSAAFLAQPGGKINFREYNWGLNDSGSQGEGYGGIRFYWDHTRNQ